MKEIHCEVLIDLENKSSFRIELADLELEDPMNLLKPSKRTWRRILEIFWDIFERMRGNKCIGAFKNHLYYLE